MINACIIKQLADVRVAAALTLFCFTFIQVIPMREL